MCSIDVIVMTIDTAMQHLFQNIIHSTYNIFN